MNKSSLNSTPTPEATKPVSFKFETTPFWSHEERDTVSEQLKKLWKTHVGPSKSLDISLKSNPATITISIKVSSTKNLDDLAASFIQNCRKKSIYIADKVSISFDCVVPPHLAKTA